MKKHIRYTPNAAPVTARLVQIDINVPSGTVRTMIGEGIRQEPDNFTLAELDAAIGATPGKALADVVLGLIAVRRGGTIEDAPEPEREPDPEPVEE